MMEFAVGWAAGSVAMCLYFWLQGLIRSREEWYEYRRKRLLEQDAIE